MKTRLIKEIGVRISLRRYWTEASDGEVSRDCASAAPGQKKFHEAMNRISDHVVAIDGYLTEEKEAALIGGKPDKADPRWPTKCETCQIVLPDESAWQIFGKRLYDSPSGEPEPGDLYWANWTHWQHEGKNCCMYWDNCNDPRGHLYCILPDGSNHPWDIMSRASNCTLKEDRQHRCWVLHEGPPVHVDKSGLTCQAGAGSIAVPGFHGFLHNGELAGC
jgi:hypothetical protein